MKHTCLTLGIFMCIPLLEITGVIGHIPLDNVANLIVSLKNNFFTQCVFIGHSEDSFGAIYKWKLVRLQKLLAEYKVETALIDVSMLKYIMNYPSGYSWGCVRPLLVIITSPNHSTNTTLNKIWKWIIISKARWLLFLSGYESLTNIFMGFDMPLDREFLVAKELSNDTIQLTEVYRVHELLPLQINQVGTWNRINGLLYTNIPLNLRRSNLRNVMFRALVVERSIFTEIRRIDKEVLVGGMYGKIWSTLEESLNFQTTFEICYDYGLPAPDGTWSGMIGKLIKGEADVAVADFVQTTARRNVVDYLSDPFVSTMAVYVREPDMEDVNWTGYLAPFSPHLWEAMVVVILLLSLGLTVTYRIRRENGYSDMNYFNFPDAVHCILGVFCGQGHVTPPKNCSSRIIILTSWLLVIVLLALYSGVLMSFLAVRRSLPLPFNNFEELLKHKSYTLGLYDPILFLMFSESNNTAIRNLYERDLQNKPHAFTNSFSERRSLELEGFNRVCSDRKFAVAQFIHSQRVLRTRGQINCKLSEVEGTYLTTSSSIILSKNNRYRNIINYKLLQMKASGIVRRYTKIYMNFKKDEKNESPATVANLQTVVPLITLLLAGILTSILILFVEKLSFLKKGDK